MKVLNESEEIQTTAMGINHPDTNQAIQTTTIEKEIVQNEGKEVQTSKLEMVNEGLETSALLRDSSLQFDIIEETIVKMMKSEGVNTMIIQTNSIGIGDVVKYEQYIGMLESQVKEVAQEAVHDHQMSRSA